MTRHRRGFTIIEVLVVIGIITALLALLLPALEKAREHANNVKCAVNLKEVGVALAIYANDNHGQYPRTMYDPAAPLAVGTNPAGVSPFSPGGPAANDTTADLFLLLRAKLVLPKTFCEPYDDEVANQPEPATDWGNRSNFTDWKKNLGYSYANPYPNAAAVTAGVQPSNKANGGFALAACLNPGVPIKNSRNHEGRGQNVLYADSHVDWKTTRQCGLYGDDIYANKNGVVEASPVDPTDSVLLPTDK